MSRRLLATALGVVLAVVAGGEGARAEPPTPSPNLPTPTEAGEAALAAFKAKDAKALERIARADSPDVWGVADGLLLRGEREAAIALAKAARPSEVATLVAYLSRTTGPADAKRWEAADAVTALWRAKRFDEAVAAARAFPDTPKDAQWVRVQHTLGLCLERPGMRAEAIRAHVEGAEVAERLGWLKRARDMYYRAGLAARSDADHEQAERWWTKVLAIDERRGEAADVARSRLNLGSARGQLRQYEAALVLLQAALKELDALGLELDAALAAKSLGMTLRNLNRLPEALPLLRRAVADFERLRRDDFLAPASVELAWAAHDVGDGKLALESAERGLRLIGGHPDPVVRARAKKVLGAAHILVGDYEEARRLGAEVLEDAETRGNPAEIADALGNLALVVGYLGRRDEAHALLVRALDAARAARDVRMEAIYAGRLVDADVAAGRVDEALRTLETVRSTQERIGAKADLAYTEHRFGTILRGRGQVADAIRHFEKACELTAATGQRRLLARAEEYLGSTYDDIGEFANAYEHLSRALEIDIGLGAEKDAFHDRMLLGIVQYERAEMAKAASTFLDLVADLEARGDTALLPTVRLNFANLLSNFGSLGEALEQIRAAEEAFAKAGNTVGARQARGSRAERLADAHRWAESAALFEEILREEEAKGDSLDAAGALHGLGLAQQALGRLEEAERSLRRAVASKEGKAPVPIVASRIALGTVLVDRGRAEEGLASIRAGVREAHAMGLADKERRGLVAEAAAQVALGRPRDAVAALRSAVALAWRNWGGFGDDETAATLVRNTPIARGVEAALAADDLAGLVFFLEASRAGSILSTQGARQALLEATRPPDMEKADADARAEELQASNDAQRALATADADAFEAAKARLEAARKSRDGILAGWTRMAKATGALPVPADPDLAALRRSLRPDEALALYGVRSKAAVAVVVTPTTVRSVVLGDGEALRAKLGAATTRGSAAGDAARLADDLVAPLGLDAGVKRLLVSPEGSLARLPWSLLAGGRSVVLVPSLSVFQALRSRTGRGGDGVLALGDPAYGTTSPPPPNVLAMRGPEARLLPLPGTREEVKRVGTEVHLGKDASETTLRNRGPAKAWRSIHLACHGVFDEATGWSALALSASDADDGYVTIPDVLRMPVKTDLVVLSACESALGQSLESEGIEGVPRAFLLAGAPRVLSSLWKVDDAATAALMQRFYERWNAGLPASDALRDAQSFVRDAKPAWADPKFWASWILWGAD
jgi:CHAT domain-containing protein